MTLARRHFIAAAAASSLGLPRIASAAAPVAPQASRPWKTYEVTTRVQLKNADAPAKLWLPMPSVTSDWQEVVDDSFGSNGNARIATDNRDGVRMLYVDFAGVKAVPFAEVTSRVRTRDRVDAHGSSDWRVAAGDLRPWLEPTAMIPTDGIVRKTALEATRGAKRDADKARMLYDWVVTNTHREPTVRGCGEGNIKAMLESGDLSGKCVDLNSLYVGLCRSVGVPARDLFGLRLSPAASGYRELGSNMAKLDGAQHCRAEVYLQGQGWTAMDPADVAKVMRQETPEWIKTTSHPLVTPVYKRLYGGWEGNWVAWNNGHDVRLPGSKSGTAPFLMYPIAEIGGDRIDSYSPAEFAYTISSKAA